MTVYTDTQSNKVEHISTTQLFDHTGKHNVITNDESIFYRIESYNFGGKYVPHCGCAPRF